MSFFNIFKSSIKYLLFFHLIVLIFSFIYFFTSEDKYVQSLLYKASYGEISKYKIEINHEISNSFNAFEKNKHFILSRPSIDKFKIEYPYSSKDIIFKESEIRNFMEKFFDESIDTLNFVIWNYEYNNHKDVANINLIENHIDQKNKINTVLIINIIAFFLSFSFIYLKWIFEERD